MLQQLQPDNAEQLINVVGDNRDYLRQYLPCVDFTKTLEDSRLFIEVNQKARNESTTYGYGIFDNEQLVGHISIMNLNNPDKKLEIGYWIAQSASGHGTTTKAVKALTDLGLNTLGLKEIIICVEPGNIVSEKVAIKAGFEFIRQCAKPDDGVLLKIFINKK